VTLATPSFRRYGIKGGIQGRSEGKEMVWEKRYGGGKGKGKNCVGTEWKRKGGIGGIGRGPFTCRR